MAFDESLADRLRDVFVGRTDIVEKKMFGGLAFMLHGNMCCGIVDDRLMARVGPEQYDEALTRRYAGPMDFTGRTMTGFVSVEPAGIESEDDLRAWVALCENFAGALPPK